YRRWSARHRTDHRLGPWVRPVIKPIGSLSVGAPSGRRLNWLLGGRGYLAMSESQQSPVFFSEDSDPEMQRAYEKARASFRFFWREVAWERRRIVPALDVAAVKAPFSDGKRGSRSQATPEIEHMWMSQVDFDGQAVSGVLMNSPNWLTTIKQGDPVRVPLSQI